jgi:SAM-dependent methyltransferase
MITSALRRLLAHPLTLDLDIDDPRTTQLRRAILQSKPFLKRLYREWYGLMAAELPAGGGAVLELGSGPGFFEEVIPGLITSEVVFYDHVRIALDGQRLPFRAGSLRAITMTNVLHHIPSARAFLSEADRCLRTGGRMVAIEPWVSRWSRLIYNGMHHEPFEPDEQGWELHGTGPLSDANGALPWIIFERDRDRFVSEFPRLRIRTVVPMVPFRYLVCGGIASRTTMPAATFALWRGFERALTPWMRSLAMFALIVVEKIA